MVWLSDFILRVLGTVRGGEFFSGKGQGGWRESQVS